MQTLALDCYLTALKNMAHYAVELDEGITSPHRKYLSALAGEMEEASLDVLAESRSTLRGLLRDYRDRSAQYLAGLRDQLAATAEALQETVRTLSESDTDHSVRMREATRRLRQLVLSPGSGEVCDVIAGVADTIDESLEQIRKQHQFTITQFQTELRLLHNRIDALETAAAIDEATKFSNRRFMNEYLGSLPSEGASLLILKIRGLGQAKARYGATIADDLIATFGRRLRNTLPKGTVVGRWSEQDFLGVLRTLKPPESSSAQRITAHLSTPYACMLGGRVVRIPLEVTAEYKLVAPDSTPEQAMTTVIEAFT